MAPQLVARMAAQLAEERVVAVLLASLEAAAPESGSGSAPAGFRSAEWRLPAGEG